MIETATPFLTGRFLLAMPGMADPRFEQAIILMVAHDEDGALGIGIGQERQGLRVKDLLRQLGLEHDRAPDAPVLHGGPVEPGRGFVLHSDDWGGQDTVEIGSLCRMTATQDVLKAIGQGEGPARFLVSLGYAGWAGGQLEEELTRHGWMDAPGDDAILFEGTTPTRWQRAFEALGIDPALLSPDSGAA
ncbi:YqgE/AlgH family protein [Sphingomicrobium astaxanthinifaciens]|uniref:YqgE/AlgH family protein n=1 Tax=Sphingomicrobium astaxanthinifaciens TaxID=1227949 RepID=UPI001FCBDD44|nr:YqgE/AlgH family protein [Sphingomicrobium astaxanthinifaciens]MCJ7422291.1 YqgE/AlgH family protein [Sphingomicrobium astaxanthinifaciens]